MDDEPIWLELDEVLESQAEQLGLFGGPPGIRDIGLIESALMRPQNMYHYEGVDDLPVLAVRLASVSPRITVSSMGTSEPVRSR